VNAFGRKIATVSRFTRKWARDFMRAYPFFYVHGLVWTPVLVLRAQADEEVFLLMQKAGYCPK